MTVDGAPRRPGAASDTVTQLVVSGTLTIDTTERAGVVHADIPGGSALYAAAAARFVLPTRIVGIVGSDFPFAALQRVWETGVDRSAIEVRDGPTFRWHARYAESGDERVTLARDPGVAAGRLPVVPPLPASGYALLLGSTDPRVQGHVLDACRGASLVGLDSMAHWWRERGDDLRRLLARVDVVFVDEEELALATGSGEAIDRVHQLLALGPGLVVVKQGSRGAWLQRRGGGALHVPAAPVPNVADTTGAGDAFAGAFVSALSDRSVRDDAQVLRFAIAVASFVVEGVGTNSLANADRAAIERRMRELP